MQSLTSNTSADVSDPSKLPAWDRTKCIYTKLAVFLKRAPRQTDDIPAMLKQKQSLYRECMEQSGESKNNTNKYFSACCLGPAFMEMYDGVNNMHMQCMYLIFERSLAKTQLKIIYC
jgi:hypothetical protein